LVSSGRADAPKGGIANEFELENQRLRKAVSELLLQKLILSLAVEAAEGPRS
jgi:hypothetical protein